LSRETKEKLRVSFGKERERGEERSVASTLGEKIKTVRAPVEGGGKEASLADAKQLEKNENGTTAAAPSGKKRRKRKDVATTASPVSRTKKGGNTGTVDPLTLRLQKGKERKERKKGEEKGEP